MLKRCVLVLLISSSIIPSVVAQQSDVTMCDMIESCDDGAFISAFEEDLEYNTAYEHVPPPPPGLVKRCIDNYGSKIVAWFFSITQMMSQQYVKFKKWLNIPHKINDKNNEKTDGSCCS